MGILEQIAEQLTENNNKLLKQIETLSEKLSLLEYEMKSGNFSDHNGTRRLSLDFSTDDKLNVTIASKILGITQAELVLLVKKGKINSIGKKKYIFLASELIRYKKGEKQDNPVNVIQRKIPVDISKKGNVAKKINSVISEKELQELYAKQAV